MAQQSNYVCDVCSIDLDQIGSAAERMDPRGRHYGVCVECWKTHYIQERPGGLFEIRPTVAPGTDTAQTRHGINCYACVAQIGNNAYVGYAVTADAAANTVHVTKMCGSISEAVSLARDWLRSHNLYRYVAIFDVDKRP